MVRTLARSKLQGWVRSFPVFDKSHVLSVFLFFFLLNVFQLDNAICSDSGTISTISFGSHIRIFSSIRPKCLVLGKSNTRDWNRICPPPQFFEISDIPSRRLRVVSNILQSPADASSGARRRCPPLCLSLFYIFLQLRWLLIWRQASPWPFQWTINYPSSPASVRTIHGHFHLIPFCRPMVLVL
jgi:hypothetical protein